MWSYADRLHEIFSVMLERGLEPDGLVRIFEEAVQGVLKASGETEREEKQRTCTRYQSKTVRALGLP